MNENENEKANAIIEILTYKGGQVAKNVIICEECECILHRHYLYCPTCGKRIDWRDFWRRKQYKHQIYLMNGEKWKENDDDE